MVYLSKEIYWGQGETGSAWGNQEGFQKQVTAELDGETRQRMWVPTESVWSSYFQTIAF